MKQSINIVLICLFIVIWVAILTIIATVGGCTANRIMADNCEIKAVTTAMKFKLHNIPHRLAVGKDHVAVQILKDDEWKFLCLQDAKCFQPLEYMSLQKYMKYLIIRYDAIDSIKGE